MWSGKLAESWDTEKGKSNATKRTNVCMRKLLMPLKCSFSTEKKLLAILW